MNFTKRMLVSMTGLVLLLSMIACQPEMKVVVADAAADEKAIRHVLDEITAKFDAADYEGMFAQYRDDVVVSSPGQPDIVGKDAWRAGLSALPKGVVMKMRFDTQELLVDGDTAYERGTFLVEMEDAATKALVPVVTGRHIHIFRREADGSWRGWRLFENSADPATALLPSAPAVPPAPKE